VTDRDQPTDRDTADPRPWEQPGAVRRDCEPHRGRLLAALGRAALVCACLGLGWLVLAFFAGPVSAAALARPNLRHPGTAAAVACLALLLLGGLSLGTAVFALARRDLARMAAGLVDPDGAAATALARDRGLVAALLVVMALVLLAGWQVL
jgi:hypothetical protein